MLAGLNSRHTTLTRMYTRISGWEMSSDPIFEPSEGGEVPNTLDLSNNAGITDACIPHLQSLPNLETLILLSTSISSAGLAKLAEVHPDTDIQA